LPTAPIYLIIDCTEPQVTKAVAYLSYLARSRKLSSFAREHKLSYVYLWQLKTPKCDPKGRPLRDRQTGRLIYRRSPSFKIINKLKSVIPTEYWYEDETRPPEADYSSPLYGGKPSRTTPASLTHMWLLPDNPFCGVLSAYLCDPELTDRSRRLPSHLPKIVLDFSF
jgi:hypothetical protein